jgi:hypothetical protein
MARRELELTHYETDWVLMPSATGKIVEAVRITIFGPNFPERAVAPEILVGKTVAHNVSITRDQRSIRGYFSELPPDGGLVRVRYGDSQEGALRAPFSRRNVRPLPKECEPPWR